MYDQTNPNTNTNSNMNSNPNPAPVQTPTPSPTPSPAPTPMPTPTQTPTPNMNSNMGGKQSEHKKIEIIWAAVILVIIVALMVLWYTKGSVKAPTTSSTQAQMQQIDLAKLLANPANPPAWFPAGLPFEVSNVSEQNVLNYPDQKIVLYSLAYNSARQMEELYAVYGSYFKDNGYTVSNQVKTQNQMTYDATKGNEIVKIVILPQGGGASVHVGIVVKQ